MGFDKIKSDRLGKLKNIISAGVNPYPSKTWPRVLIAEIIKNFDRLASPVSFAESSRAEQKKAVVLAGRLRSLRGHGGSTFANLEDYSGQIQIYLKKDEVGEDKYKFFIDGIDIGDFIEVSGELFKTQKGELTLLVKKYELLSKSLSQLPEKWHGLQDVEERFRRRYLDLLMNKEVRARFKKRSEIIKKLRQFLEGEGFIEVETPILQSLPGGALAKPFKTHLNALDLDLYLRIAPELYLKRLIIGGFEKVFEIGRLFRNEGMDRFHNPEFTELEFYWAYVDYEDLMALTEKMFKALVPEGQIEFQGKKIDLTAPFKKISMRDLLIKELDLDIDKADEDEFLNLLASRGAKLEDDKPSRAIDALFKIVRPNLFEPTFVIDHPLEMSPLAKEKENTVLNKKYAQRFQLIIGGVEITNAYTELNDPQEQARRMQEQEKLHKDEARYDQDFIEALEYGLPPCAGLGLGIDRLVQLLTDSLNVREIILFPTMKPVKK